VLVAPQQLARDLRARLGLARAIETGTYRGRGTRLLADVFPAVVTIEVAPALARAAAQSLEKLEHVVVVEGSSRQALPGLIDPAVPTLYWLDGHWSGGPTGGEEDECPVLAEVDAIGLGHPDDCILIDDARLFLAPPPPPHRADQWPTYREIDDALRRTRPQHRTLVAHDVIVSVPERAFDLAVEFSARKAPRSVSLARRALNRALVR
jgi:hypothetical protein